MQIVTIYERIYKRTKSSKRNASTSQLKIMEQFQNENKFLCILVWANRELLEEQWRFFFLNVGSKAAK